MVGADISRPEPPLCKGRWHGECRDGGIVSTGLQMMKL